MLTLILVSLGRYHCSANVAETANDNSSHTEEETMRQILQQENSAAGIFCWLKANHLSRALDLPLTKDVLGVVASLARVDDDNLSRSAVFILHTFPMSLNN
jgi:hypothetical protein